MPSSINNQPRKQGPRAVLWDLDGTILDSSHFHWLSWSAVLAAEGHPITYDQFISTFGQRNSEILQTYFGPDLSSTEIDRISAAKEEKYRELVRTRGIEPLPGVRRWLERLREDGWRQAIASSAPLLNVETILDALRIGDYFDAIVTGEDVDRGKPDPEVFLKAAAKLGAPPSRCVVVEDAPAGIEAARRAGMRVIGVLPSHSELSADLVAAALDDLPDNAFDGLLIAGEAKH